MSDNEDQCIATLKARLETLVGALQAGQRELEAQLAHWRDIATHCTQAYEEAEARSGQLEAKLIHMTAALKRYGSHRAPCASQTWDHPAWGIGTNKSCSCGLEATLKGEVL